MDDAAACQIDPADITAALVGRFDEAIDEVTARAVPARAFLRRSWYRAAGGRAPATVVVRAGGRARFAMPLVRLGPLGSGLVQLPGSYWPWRSAAIAADAPGAVGEAALACLGRRHRGVRIGPVADDDPALAALRAGADVLGWTVLRRHVADSWVLDLDARREEGWPRTSTLRKNRFHEKHLASHGALDWRFVGAGDWPAAFDALASVERASWISARTDGRDAKFTAGGHGAFWRAAAADPALAAMMRAAVLYVEGSPRAFSFDLDTGALIYAIANSYDPALGKHSPGKLLAYRNLAAAIARGARAVDWGAGDSGYKQVMGAERGPALRDWLLIRPGWAAMAARAVARGWQRG